MTTAENFMLVGVGGQGTLLAADVVAEVGLLQGLQVKKSEVHGMAQRGGSVTSHVRWGQVVYAPLIVPGEVDVLLAFERLEALRYVAMLRPQGTILVNDYRIAPVSVSSGKAQYPTHEQEVSAYESVGIQWMLVPAIAIAQELGNARVNNVVLLGALAAQFDVPTEIWKQVIAERVPARFVDLNLAAFDRGMAYMAQPA